MENSGSDEPKAGGRSFNDFPEVTFTLRVGHVAHQEGPGGEAVSIADEQGKTISVEARPDGSIEFTIKARPPRGEEGTLDICRRLVERLNQEGGHWSGPRDVSAISDDADCVARDGEATLRIQVVHAETSGAFWSKLAAAGRLPGSATDRQLADALRATIEHKIARTHLDQRRKLILALRADIAQGHGLLVVRNAFRRAHGEWAKELGFQAIWIVGAGSSLMHRLDA